MKVHFFAGSLPVRLRVAVLALGNADELRLSIASQISKGRDSLSVWSKILWQVQWVPLCPSVSRTMSCPGRGKPTIRMSFPLSLLKS